MSRELHALRSAWGWTGVEFADVIAHSLMGHMLVEDRHGEIHYLDPEMGQVIRLGDDAATQAYMAKDETQVVWRADALIDAAVKRLGPPTIGEVYSLTLPALLAGDYAHENLIKLDLVELIYLSGDLARQTQDLPEGARLRLTQTN